MSLDTIVVFIINTLIAVTESLLGVRFFLKLLGASDAAPFVRWIYETSQSLLEPFANMFPSPSIGRLFVVEFTTLFAMIVYAAVGYFAVRLFEFVYNHVISTLQKTSPPEKPEKPTQYMA